MFFSDVQYIVINYGSVTLCLIPWHIYSSMPIFTI